MSEVEVIVLAGQGAFARLEDLATTKKWARASATRRSHVVMASVTWRMGRAEIGYYEDHCADVQYLRLEGPGAGELAGELREKLEHHGLEDTLTAAANASEPGESIRSLNRLSVMAPENGDPRFVGVWKTKLQHPQRAVRRAAIRTAYAMSWPSMLVLIKERAQRESHLKPQVEDLLGFLENDSGH